MTDAVLYVDLTGLDEREQGAFLAEASAAGLAVDELYGSLGVVSVIFTVMSTSLNAVIEELSKEGAAAALVRLTGLLGHLFSRKDRDVAVEDRETRISFAWDATARGDLKAATAAMMEVAAALHLVTDGTVFRWDAAAQRWYAAPR